MDTRVVPHLAFPRLKLRYLRDDGEGGVELVIITSKGEEEVSLLADHDIADWLGRLAHRCSSRYRELYGRVD